MEIWKVIAAIVLTSVLSYLGVSTYKKMSHSFQIDSLITSIAVVIKQIEMSKDISGYTMKNSCDVTTVKGFTKTSIQLLEKDKWLGLEEDYIDCSLTYDGSVDNLIEEGDFKLIWRISKVISSSGDFILIWKDNNKNGIADTNEKLQENYTESFKHLILLKLKQSMI